MAEKLTDIRDLATDHANKICSSPENWTNYLDTASRFYRYPFIDTFLIHAQRPGSKALATMSEWNNIMKRWVNKGAKGIALFDHSGANLKLRYVFDIRDTHPVKGARPLSLWSMSSKKEKMLKEHLQKTYDLKISNKDRMPKVLEELSSKLTAENISQAMYDLNRNKGNSYLSTMDEVALLNHFTKLIEESVTYVLMKRCGYHPLEHMDIENFEMIRMFDDISVLPYLGEAIHTITEPVLMDIGIKVHEYDKREYQKKLENTPIQGQMEFKLDGKEVIYDIKSKANTATEDIYGREKEHRVCEDRRLLLSDSQGKTKQESKEKPDSKVKEGASSKVRSCASDREREIRQAVASTVMLPLLPTPKQQQELIQKSIETAITSKSPTSLHKRLNDKRIEANIINSKRVVKSAIKRQKGMGL